MDKTSKIFVAGHNGLVGSAITKQLREKGYNNLLLFSHKELDLEKQADTEHFFSVYRPEYVFLAAAFVGGIDANNKYRADFIYHNLQIQNNVIGFSHKYGVKKLLFLGSTCIYPRLAPQPMKEDCLLTSALEYTNEPYALSKIAGMRMCESFNLQYGTNFISVMPTNLYGPNDNFDLQTSHVMPALIRKIFLAKCLYDNAWDLIKKDLNKNPIKDLDLNSETSIIETLKTFGIQAQEVEIWGTGNALREFLYSEEMAQACIFIMENVDFKDLINPNDKQIRNTHINIGTGEEISIKNLVDVIVNVLDYKGKIVYNIDKPDGTPRKLTDCSKLHSLGWKHNIDLRTGVKMLYDWYLNF